jgi:FtsP/CotA-like multicopper oxidase with cupredoxin domain
VYQSKRISRREFLRKVGVVSASLMTSYFIPRLVYSKTKNTAKSGNVNTFNPDLEIALKATKDKVSILPGSKTPVWTYQGEVLKGDPRALQVIENSYLGPIIRVRKGQKIRIQFQNEINDVSIIHWHGMHVPEEMDGHPRYVIPQNKTYVYEFEVKNRAGTYWYHPHPHMRTGPQVYFGLAGLFLISDDEEEAVGLPSRDYDIPLVIQDRLFDGGNQFIYLVNGMMDQMMGFLGDQILVNGQVNFQLQVSTRAYRFRILNGSNSRIYKLAWNNGMPVTVIATDGGFLEKPMSMPYVMLGPGERVELWADFSGIKVGTDLLLKSLSFDAGMMGGMDGMMRGMGGMGRRGRGRGIISGDLTLPNGAELSILRISVNKKEKVKDALPDRLSTIKHYQINEAENRYNPRTFNFQMQMMRWTINGRIFEMTNVADYEIVRLNTIELWEFINEGAGMGMMGMMQMAHPVHVHGLQFQIIDRSIDNGWFSGWETVREGFVDEGLKDTVLLMPGMRVSILLKFEDYAGLFLYHCHNLEHEDMGMMRNYLVQA